MSDSGMIAAERQQLAAAAQQAWIGLWHGCMRDAGGVSRMPYSPAIVAHALKEETIEYAKPPPVPHKGVSEWARQLEGDERISGITLGELLVGLEDYFKIFRQLKKTHRSAYDYFSRVGVPLCFDSLTVLRRAITDVPVVDHENLPSCIGVFMTRSREEARDLVLSDKPAFLDFQLYEKRRRNIVVAAPWKWTLYDHTEISFSRDVFTKEERRRLPQAGEWGFHYYVGIDRDGRVAALPMKMSTYQPLKSGGSVHHGHFIVPPGLKDMSGSRGIDAYVAAHFAAVRAFAASAMSGVQMSVRRGDEVARFGIPLAYVRSFFRDREREGMRRKPLLHLVGTYQYQRANRTVTVGEHLRGARRFAWRGHDIHVTAPGITHAAPEVLAAELLADDDLLPMPAPATITPAELGAQMQQKITSLAPVRFRRGMPVATYQQPSMGVVP